MTRADCHWLNPSLRQVKQCCSRYRTRSISFWGPEKLSVDQCFEIFFVHDRKGIPTIWVWRCLSLASKPQELPTRDFNEQHASIFTRFVKWLVCLFLFLWSMRLIAFPAPKIGSQAYYLSLIHISEPTRPLYISYAVFCLKKKNRSQFLIKVAL